MYFVRSFGHSWSNMTEEQQVALESGFQEVVRRMDASGIACNIDAAGDLYAEKEEDVLLAQWLVRDMEIIGVM